MLDERHTRILQENTLGQFFDAEKLLHDAYLKCKSPQVNKRTVTNYNFLTAAHAWAIDQQEGYDTIGV